VFRTGHMDRKTHAAEGAALINSPGEYPLAGANVTEMENEVLSFGSNPPLPQHPKRSQSSQGRIIGGKLTCNIQFQKKSKDECLVEK
jgi:hypothetical protein